MIAAEVLMSVFSLLAYPAWILSLEAYQEPAQQAWKIFLVQGRMVAQQQTLAVVDQTAL
jgi:hypothetical protein